MATEQKITTGGERKRRGELPSHNFLLEPFDIGMFATAEGVQALHQNFTGFLAGLTTPARFLCWQLPVSLESKIAEVSREARRAAENDEMERAQLCSMYRRHYEELNDRAHYQLAVCGMSIWSDDNPNSLAAGMKAAFDTSVIPGEFPALFRGKYVARESPMWHLAPAGRDQNRPYWAVLVSYEFNPTKWNFFRPLPPLLQKNYPMALAVDISRSFERNDGINALEGMVSVWTAHLVSSGAEDTRGMQRLQDCRATLDQMQNGDTLHQVTIAVAVSAPSVEALKNQIATIIGEMKPYFSLRPEGGELLMRAVRFFGPTTTKEINLPDTSWPVVSRELAMFLSPLGYPKLTHTRGILRGDSVTGNYPLFYDSWRDKRGRDDKRCVHEVWVGVSGFGKTFYCNCYLTREYAEGGVPFDLLEPMGHGRMVADAFHIPWFVISSRATVLNPQDIMMPMTISDQVSHVIRLYETMLTRRLTGDRLANIQRGLLSEALIKLYDMFGSNGEWRNVATEDAPTCEDVVHMLKGLGKDRGMNPTARELAEEIAVLTTGQGPFASFVNGHTSIDLSFMKERRAVPRVFSFHEMESDPILLGLAYTQVLSAIRRDSLSDERPRIIAVDEVYRLMRHASLLEFLVEAAKTFRTRRKKLICIDQQMSTFLDGKARSIFENSPIRVVFNQRQGLNVFREDAAFQHLNAEHLRIISMLPRFHFVLDVQDEGLWYLANHPSLPERERFGSS